MHKSLTRGRVGVVGASGLLLAAVLTTARASVEPVTPTQQPSLEMVERGRYLVTVTGCNDCHTPMIMGANGPVHDKSRFLSGHPETLVMPEAPALVEGPWGWTGAASMTAFAGPWGVSYAANLTPDENTGIGIWTEDIFVQTLRSGRHWGQSRPILPPMPWENFAQMTDDDLRAVFAYLKSLPPIQNRVPDAILPAPAVAEGEVVYEEDEVWAD